MEIVDEKDKVAVAQGQFHTSSGSDAEHIKSDSSNILQGPVDFKSVAAEPVDNIFSQGGNNYRTLRRKDTILVMFTNQIGLGILSLPSILKTMGMVPGIIALIGIGAMSWYTAYQLLQFYRRHPHVVNIVDMCRVVGGRPFEIAAGIMLMIQLLFTAASAVVTMSIAFNTLSDHATCTVTFITVASLVCCMLGLPRTMKFVSLSGVPNAVSVIAAAMIVIVSLGVSGPVAAPDDWHREIKIVGNPTFSEGLTACLKIVFAYASNMVFVTYMAEMVDPDKDFNYCLTWLEGGSMVFYTGIAIILYCLGGEYTTSPILGTAATIPAKVAYGVVLPAVTSTGMSIGHTGCKYVYVSIMRQRNAVDQLTANTFTSWSTWVFCVTSFWIITFIISNVIPIFDSILSISSATTVGWLTYGFSAIFWLHSNWDAKFNGWKKTGVTVNDLFINGAGLWAAVTGLIDSFNSEDSSISGVFSCGSNAQF
ncbi:transmembrane amino acid transporter protein-domain-containing protein [Thelonectria olida]|uniref:Transmembrane amino acid transporter protein-domain-containing protein n=1 Tax=Thelonectria olida TaxID=1576542 RepID=A0A9P8W6N3_9HYPO|nr:transmembrane amino acid transporter protein-domain-containing protein [Thelonectria olida]